MVSELCLLSRLLIMSHSPPQKGTWDRVRLQTALEDTGADLKFKAHEQGQLFSGALSLGVSRYFHF